MLIPFPIHKSHIRLATFQLLYFKKKNWLVNIILLGGKKNPKAFPSILTRHFFGHQISFVKDKTKFSDFSTDIIRKF